MRSLVTGLAFLLLTLAAGASAPPVGDGRLVSELATNLVEEVAQGSGAGISSVRLHCAAGKMTHSSRCVACPKGQFQSAANQKICPQCLSGQFQDTTGQATCKLCNSGSKALNAAPGAAQTDYPAVGAQTKLECTVDPCAAGRYRSGEGAFHSKCLPCAAGKFQPSRDETECQLCPNGQFQDKAGSPSCVQCGHAFLQTAAQGQRLPLMEVPWDSGASRVHKSSCRLHCHPGRYPTTRKPENDAGDQGEQVQECKACAAGQYRKNSADVDGKPVPPAMTACLACLPGRYASDPASGLCHACNLGEIAAKWGSSWCHRCDKGHVPSPTKLSPPAGAAGKGLTAGTFPDTHCLKCDAGQYAPDAGEGVSQLVDPLDKTTGAESDETGQVCVGCPTGQVSDGGAVACTRCEKGRFNAGSGGGGAAAAASSGADSKSPLGKRACARCPPGKFAPVEGWGSCEVCGPGTSSTRAAAAVGNRCGHKCPPGKYIATQSRGPAVAYGSCQPCPQGKFQTKFLGHGCLTCEEDHTTLQPGAQSPSQCVTLDAYCRQHTSCAPCSRALGCHWCIGSASCVFYMPREPVAHDSDLRQCTQLARQWEVPLHAIMGNPLAGGSGNGSNATHASANSTTTKKQLLLVEGKHQEYPGAFGYGVDGKKLTVYAREKLEQPKGDICEGTGGWERIVSLEAVRPERNGFCEPQYKVKRLAGGASAVPVREICLHGVLRVRDLQSGIMAQVASGAVPALDIAQLGKKLRPSKVISAFPSAGVFTSAAVIAGTSAHPSKGISLHRLEVGTRGNVVLSSPDMEGMYARMRILGALKKARAESGGGGGEGAAAEKEAKAAVKAAAAAFDVRAGMLSLDSVCYAPDHGKSSGAESESETIDAGLTNLDMDENGFGLGWRDLKLAPAAALGEEVACGSDLAKCFQPVGGSSGGGGGGGGGGGKGAGRPSWLQRQHDLGGTWKPAQFIVSLDPALGGFVTVVRLRGLLELNYTTETDALVETAGGVGLHVATLPREARPSVRMEFLAVNVGEPVRARRVTVTPDGDVSVLLRLCQTPSWPEAAAASASTAAHDGHSLQERPYCGREEGPEQMQQIGPTSLDGISFLAKGGTADSSGSGGAAMPGFVAADPSGTGADGKFGDDDDEGGGAAYADVAKAKAKAKAFRTAAADVARASDASTLSYTGPSIGLSADKSEKVRPTMLEDGGGWKALHLEDQQGFAACPRAPPQYLMAGERLFLRGVVVNGDTTGFAHGADRPDHGFDSDAGAAGHVLFARLPFVALWPPGSLLFGTVAHAEKVRSPPPRMLHEQRTDFCRA